MGLFTHSVNIVHKDFLQSCVVVFLCFFLGGTTFPTRKKQFFLTVSQPPPKSMARCLHYITERGSFFPPPFLPSTQILFLSAVDSVHCQLIQNIHYFLAIHAVIQVASERISPPHFLASGPSVSMAKQNILMLNFLCLIFGIYGAEVYVQTQG